MSARARLLRKRLKEQKEANEPPKPKEPEIKEEKEDESKKSLGVVDSNNTNKKNDNKNKNEAAKKAEEKKKLEDIDPLNFFNQEREEIKPINPNEQSINALLGIVDDTKKETEKEKEKEEEEDSDSSDDDDTTNVEQQRLQNRLKNQQKLFSNANNRVNPSNLFKPKKKPENLTKEIIMEKFGDDFDGAVELPELNEQKKQIMLKKMRKTINKMSSLRIQKHMDSELRQMIEEKIEELKKLKGVNYSKIASTVEELILSLKQPDYYFGDDEDVHQITDVQEPYNVEPRKDIDFAFLMKQTDTSNVKN